MFRVLSQRWKQGYRTADYPATPPKLSERFAGAPVLHGEVCRRTKGIACEACSAVCPTGAMSAEPLSLDLGRCLGCGACAAACPEKAIRFSGDYKMAVRSRDALVVKPGKPLELAPKLEPERLKLYRKSFKLRQVSAAGCNACEADANVLGTLAFDMGRFGIQFVASPRHADALLVTGPVSEGMREALLKTWEALPDPRVLIVSGACAISGGPFAGHKEVSNGATDLLPVDLFVPGCPVHPYTLLDGMLRLLGRI